MSATHAASVILLLAAALSLGRLLRGPTLGDRLVSLEVLAPILVALITVLGIERRTALFADVAAVIAILGYIGTVAAARYLRGQRPFE